MIDGALAAAVAERLAVIRERIARAAPDPSAVRVVAVTKGFGAEAVVAALDVGIDNVGENYAAELLAKAGALDPDIRPAWHFLGAVQRNKVARLAPVVSCWQSVCRLEEGMAIARHRADAAVLVQVRLSDLPGRRGVPRDDVATLVRALGGEGVEVQGLMAVGPPGPPEASREGFRSVARLAEDLGLPVVSMGMTDDLEVAVAEGSTMVRIGRALFGGRPMPAARRGSEG